MVTWHKEPNIAGLIVSAEDIKFTSEEVAVATTLTDSYYFVKVDASSGSITITLPAVVSCINRAYTIKKIDSSGNKVTIDGNSTETIDGEETIDLTLQYSYVTIVCDGDEWHIIGGEYVKMEDKLDDLLEEQKYTSDATDKLIFLLAKMEKHLGEMSELEIDDDDIKEEVIELEVSRTDE